MDIKILFEDDYIIIVNKPNNILIHNSYYARNIKDPTLLELLFKQFNHHFFPVHRLDRKTSGVLLLTKDKTTVSIFQELFNSNSIQKTYLSIVRGFIDKPIKIESPVKNPDTLIYKDAETYCEPLLTKCLNIPVKPFDTSRYSLVKLIPTTGRMHQLRIHMNKISHPIVCDSKYGDRFHNRMFEEQFNCKNIFLHAQTLKLTHPITKKKLNVKAELPKDWHTIFNKFKWKL